MSSLPRSLTLKRINPLTTSTTAIHSVPRVSAIISPAIYHKSYSTGIRPRAPGPIPLGSVKDQAEFEKLVKMAESEPATSHPDAKVPVPEEFEGDTNPATGEVGGPKREPVRFGDWSFKGRVTDF
ncbi:putative mitochondrial protein, conserved [Entomortierella beljakovae]|nr:putative mitochondrial protein, conserved [Entomortierella beljakovae]